MIAERLTAQMVAGRPARTPEEVVNRLLAVQAQDPRGARLSIRSRSVGLASTDVDAALTARRSLVVAWLQRGTLHLVASDDYWWLHPLTTPQLATGSARRLAQEGVDPAAADRGVAAVMTAVRADGPQTRMQLRDVLARRRVPTAGQALVQLLFAASLRHDLVRGPVIDGEQAFVSAAEWLPAPAAPASPEEALARLARRYLAGHGPADARDLAKWAGITLGDARRGLRAIAGVTNERGGLVDLADHGPAGRRPRPRLLGPFDPILHGWASRRPFVGAHSHVVTSNGVFRPVVLVGGRVVGTWRLASGLLTVDLLDAVDALARAALRRDAWAVLTYLGLPVTEPAGL